MRQKALVTGLAINGMALLGLVLLALANIFGVAFEMWSGGLGPFIFLWSSFVLGTLLCLGSPVGTFVCVGSLIFSVAALALFYSPSLLAMGVPFGMISILIYCNFQETLAKARHDVSVLALIKRAYYWPIRIFLLCFLLTIAAMSTGLHLVAVPVMFLGFVACPVWGLIYVAVISIQLVRVVKPGDNTAASSYTGGGPTGY